MVQERPEEPAGENRCREPNLWRETRDHNRERRGFGDRRTLQKEIRRGRRQEVLLKAGRGGSASSSVRAPFALTQESLERQPERKGQSDEGSVVDGNPLLRGEQVALTHKFAPRSDKRYPAGID